jgi:predicted metal-binding protein
LIEDDLDKFCKYAVSIGCTSAKPIKAGNVVTAHWTILKCKFGCKDYKKRLTCPPYSPTAEETRKVLDEFNWGIIVEIIPKDIATEWKEMHELIQKVEREVFLSGYYAAFAYTLGSCPYCSKCNLTECSHPDLARPSMEASGIDVFATIRSVGYDIQVMRDKNQQPKFYGLILVK